jgi:hypothetical protein
MPTALDTDAVDATNSSSEITEAVAAVPWRSLVHNLLCGSLPRVPTLQELTDMRLSFKAAVAAAAAATIEQVPTITESDAPTQERQPVEDAAASASTTAATGASSDVTAVTGEANSASGEIVSVEGEAQLDTTAAANDAELVNSDEAMGAAPARSPLYSVPLWFELLEGSM